MYNRYIPEDTSYTRIEAQRPPDRPRSPSPGNGRSVRFPDFLSSGKEGLSSLLKSLHLDNIDSGDILLMLILLYLLVEGDDIDLVIALGAVLFLGLGEDKET